MSEYSEDYSLTGNDYDHAACILYYGISENQERNEYTEEHPANIRICQNMFHEGKFADGDINHKAWTQFYVTNTKEGLWTRCSITAPMMSASWMGRTATPLQPWA